jgi:NAD+ synthase (glutamine-hydrolysing)
MSRNKLRLAIAQINLSVGDFEGNAKKIVEYISLAYKKKADIIAFPELAICGYPPEDLLLKPHFIKENEIFVRKIAKKTPEILTLIGLARQTKNSLYNSCAIVFNKKIYGYYQKVLLPNYGVFDEKRYFEVGKEAFILKYGKTFMGVNICEDIWHKTGPHALQAKSGAQLIINISSSPYYKGKINERCRMLANRAIETDAYVAYCNLIGGQDELVFDGGSLVFSPKGNVLSQAPQFKEKLLLVDLDIDLVNSLRKKHNFICSKRLPTIKIPISSRRIVHRSLVIKEKKVRFLKEEEEVYEALKLGLRDYVKKNHFKRVVLGLSGGIDSALCATIAVDSLGENNVVAVIMPSRFTSFATLNDAVRLAKRLNIKFFLIPINSMYHSYLENLKNIFGDRKQGVTEENIQARIRGNILMAISNKFGYLVLTTGNKSETSVGYCTLYGDMAGGFAILKDVPKTLVYKLSKYRNSFKKTDTIPLSIIKRPPSAELKMDQKDQDTLPPYPILDKILKLYVEEDKSLQQIIKVGFDKKLVRRIINMVDKNEYKRRQSPPGIKITPKAFGKDRRMPISNQYVVR